MFFRAQTHNTMSVWGEGMRVSGYCFCVPSILFICSLYGSMSFPTNVKGVWDIHATLLPLSACCCCIRADPTLFSHSNPQNGVWGKGLWFPAGVWATSYFLCWLPVFVRRQKTLLRHVFVFACIHTNTCLKAAKATGKALRSSTSSACFVCRRENTKGKAARGQSSALARPNHANV